MKAISLWQPWASFLVMGTKKIETRGWHTSYRGPLLIHAAQRRIKHELFLLSLQDEYRKAMDGLQWDHIPFGALVGIVELIDCVRTERISPVLSSTEVALGNYAHGRYGWICSNPITFETPIPYKGQQGFFDVDESVFPAEMTAYFRRSYAKQ